MFSSVKTALLFGDEEAEAGGETVGVGEVREVGSEDFLPLGG